ncbi:MAG: ABC transporter permease, partial [Bifidobacteriaceae bacterium]|nr:ABC transporter permease [Bifidobacteriaceae bacterium]
MGGSASVLPPTAIAEGGGPVDDSAPPLSDSMPPPPPDQASPRGPGRRSHGALWRYIAKRLVIAVFLLFGMTLVTFSLTNLVPGDPVAAALGQRAADDPETVARFRAEYGLDKNLPAQYLAYLGRLIHLDLGTSWYTHEPVRAGLAKAVPATMEIAFGA